MRGAARYWAETMCRTCGVSVHVTGTERADFSRPLVILANHQSLFDIPVLYRALPEAYGMLAKKSLFRIPFFGASMEALGCVPIDRSRRKAGFSAIAEAARIVREGSTIVIFPEGKRSRAGELLPLKKGPFYLAQMAKVPILPVGIQGTHEVLPRGSLRITPGVVRVAIGEPFTVGPSAEDREEARHRAFGAIAKLSGLCEDEIFIEKACASPERSVLSARDPSSQTR